MGPKKTRAIGIFANSVCVGSLLLRKSDSPLRVHKTDLFSNTLSMAASGGKADCLIGEIQKTAWPLTAEAV